LDSGILGVGIFWNQFRLGGFQNSVFGLASKAQSSTFCDFDFCYVVRMNKLDKNLIVPNED